MAEKYPDPRALAMYLRGRLLDMIDDVATWPLRTTVTPAVYDRVLGWASALDLATPMGRTTPCSATNCSTRQASTATIRSSSS